LARDGTPGRKGKLQCSKSKNWEAPSPYSKKKKYLRSTEERRGL